ncbi:CHRD domain-containing protein [Agromyces subbeticus]|uniref:CHRD domain-containing protein n=1 Tax=Agromyces subbeticus TaxID=293890 RepID=UPI00047CF07C|nr:CHRD domain-containing protein [Agromyces subbeticus]
MNSSNHARTSALALTFVAALTLGGAGVAAAAPPDSPAIPLNTGQEVPAPTLDGNHGLGGARGTFSYDIDGSQLCWELSVTGLSAPATAAHIHVAERNAAGPVVVPLTVQSATSFETSGCATPPPAVLAAIDDDPRAYYVNVHNASNPAGEIRGQLK